MPHRPLLAVAGWLAAAVAATLTGLAAVQFIGDEITASIDGGVLTPQQVERQLGAATASPSDRPSTGQPSATPTAAPTAAPSATGARKGFTTRGGRVVAECKGATVFLVSYSPAQGFGVKSADPGPDEHAEVTFEGPAGKVEFRAQCASGQPTASWKEDD
ncbi:hypothetical protein [Streptomyces sp. NPDC000880]